MNIYRPLQFLSIFATPDVYLLLMNLYYEIQRFFRTTNKLYIYIII